MAPSMGGLSDPSAPYSQVHLLSSLPSRQMDRQTADMHVLQIHASFKYVAYAQSGKLSLIYSSPGTHKTHKTELERHPLIILDKVNHKHSLSDGWRVQYTSVECLSWLGLQASGLDLTGRWTHGRFFLHLEAISFLFPLQLQIIQDHPVATIEQRRCVLVSCLVDGPFQIEVQVSKVWANYFIHSSSQSSTRWPRGTLTPCRCVIQLLQQILQVCSIHVPCGLSTGVWCHEHESDVTCFPLVAFQCKHLMITQRWGMQLFRKRLDK